jgi:hypothetical protein
MIKHNLKKTKVYFFSVVAKGLVKIVGWGVAMGRYSGVPAFVEEKARRSTRPGKEIALACAGTVLGAYKVKQQALEARI